CRAPARRATRADRTGPAGQRVLIRATTVSAPAAAMAPATRSIASTPSTYATANGLPAVIAALVRDSTSAPSAAIPAAMPSWRAVLLTPEAIPLWLGGTTASAATVIVGFTRPEPAPHTTRPGIR